MSHDYTSGGFDRGHMCPHSDRAANEETSYSTFVMTNIIPQAPNVNEKAWAQLEDYGRELVRKQHAHLYVIAGPAGKGGRGTGGYKQSIGGENGKKVAVPAECWKVIVVVPEGGQANQSDLTKMNSGTRVIAVVMPNDEYKVTGYEWSGYRTNVAAVEQKTGVHFFDRLPSDVATALKQKVDAVFIPPPEPSAYEGRGGAHGAE
jgi:endonuclease G